MAKNNFSFNNRYRVETLEHDTSTGIYQIVERDCGKVFISTSASVGATQIQLPEASMIYRGFNFKLVVGAAQTSSIEHAAGGVIVPNNTAVGVASGRIGNEIYAICDGSSWFVYGKTDGGEYEVVV